MEDNKCRSLAQNKTRMAQKEDARMPDLSTENIGSPKNLPIPFNPKSKENNRHQEDSGMLSGLLKGLHRIKI